MKPIQWVFIILSIQQAICAPQKLDDSDKQQLEIDDEHDRLKRASRNGQTQSQYLNFGDSQTEGKADAEITRYGSRASVSGSNGMGQAQSQSSGSGCDECYGSESSYTNGAARGPDPLRSSSGGGIQQSHASSQSPSVYDAYGRPYTLPSSGYSSQAFGQPPTRGPTNVKDLQTFDTGFPSSGDNIPQNGVLSVTPASITVSTNPAGNIYQPNRGQSPNMGGSSFLNRPISNGKPQMTGSDRMDHTTRPSILAGRKTTTSILDNKLVDGSPSSSGMQPTSSRPSTSAYGSPGSNFPDSSLPLQRIQPNRGSYDSRIGTGGQQSPYDTSTSTPSGNDSDRSRAPSGSGSYDRTFNKPPTNDGDRSKTATDSVSHPSSLPNLSQTSNPSNILTPGIQPGSSGYTYGSQSPVDHGTGSAVSQLATDSSSNLRNAFKLPPGLCLVRCDTLKPGQYSLTPEQIRDAFIASGLIDTRGGPSQDTAVSTVPTGSQSSQRMPQYQQPSGVHIPQGTSFPQTGLPTQTLPSANQYIPGSTISSQNNGQLSSQPGLVLSPGSYSQYQQPSGVGSQLSQGLPQYQQPSVVGSQSSQGLPQYQQPSNVHIPQGTSFPQAVLPTQTLPSANQYGSTIPSGSYSQYQQPSGVGLQSSQGLPQYQQPSGAVSQSSQGLPQYQQPSGAVSQSSQGLPQYQQPSGVGSQLFQGLPQYQQPSGAVSQSSQGLPQYQQSSNVHIPPGTSFPQTGLPTQTLPSANQYGSTIPSGSYSQYQQPSNLHIPQGTSFPQTGLPTQAIPSTNQYLPGLTVPSPSNGQLISQPRSYQGSVPSLVYPSISPSPQGQLPSPGYVIPATSIYPQPGGAHFPGASGHIPSVSGGVYPNVENYQETYSQQGGVAIGPNGTPTDGSFSGIGIQSVPGIGQLSSPVPSAGNLVYGGGDGSSGSSQTGDVGSENGSTSGVDEDGHSQAESSIKNGAVEASAQGTKNGGTAQTQVRGTYSGTGSFSASAQTADKDRSAQAQVNGHKDGALSSSQGSGGKSQAQSQVVVDEKTGGTSASGQSSGAKHASQSEVVANEKGGLADAQSSGPGQTSSQAQIGFRPEGAQTNPSENIFNGGGQASAQSGVHSGQSQSQIQGSFKYGISYHGAAQAASGTKEQVSTYRENSKKLFQSIGQFSRSNRGSITQAPSDIANINEIGLRPLPKATAVAPDTIPDESGLDDEDYNEMNDEGEDEYNDSPNPSKEIKTKTIRVEIELPKRDESSKKTEKPKKIEATTPATDKIENKIADSAKLIRMPAVRNENVPDGFKGKIGEKQRAPKNQIDFDKKVDVKPDTYVTVTKSVSGTLDNSKASNDDDKKFESTYYTKTSTCGYFTFSCNIVYGSNGRSKICRPKAPENRKC